MVSLCRMCHILQTIERHLLLNSKTFVVRHSHRNTHRQTCMTAWQISQYGDSSQLHLNKNVPIPVVRRPWDVLVKIHAASINPIDVMMIGGYGSATLNGLRHLTCGLSHGSEFPLTLGRDFSGTVVATGRAVPSSLYKPGDEVWGAGDPWRQGTFAEYTVINALQISHKPKTLGHAEAATIPYVGATSWAALCTFGCLEPKAMIGKRALVLGGSGGIGTFSIQLLKAWGAHVTTTCASDAVMPVLELGADIAIDYTTQDVFSELQQVDRFDVILDATGDNSKKALPLLKQFANSRYITLTTPFLRNNDENMFPFGLLKTGFALGTRNYQAIQEGKTYRWGLFIPNGLAMKQIAAMVDEGKIHPVLQNVYSFDNLPSAFAKVGEKHARGKSVIDIAGSYTTQQQHESATSSSS